MKKRTISLFVCLALLLSIAVPALAANFSDVGSSFSWAKDAIEELSGSGVINGYPDGTFKPGANITKEEAVALFAKALGYNDEANGEIVDFAKNTYSALMTNYTSYAKDQAAFLVYKEVLTTEDIASYVATANKGEALKRYEAAMMIAKALGADAWLSKNPDYSLNFDDAGEIPTKAKPYVYYAADKGIMTGMTEDTFVPEGNVTRAQVAVMIHRILTSMEFEYTSGVITNVDINTITIKTEKGETVSYKVPQNVIVTVNGGEAALADLEVGSDVVLTNSKSLLYAIDSIKTIPDEAIVGAYKGKLTDNTATTVKIQDLETGVTTSYRLAANAAIKYKDKAGSLSSYANGDYIIADLKGGEIAVINAEPKDTVIDDLIVEGVEFSPDVTLRLRDKQGAILSYGVKGNATLKRNSKTVDFSELAIGDTVDITLEYGVVSSVSAIGISKTVEGSIEEITISKNTSYITVNTGKEAIKYAMSRDVSVTVDGKEGSIYDIRLGATVEFSAQSSTVTKLTVKSASTSTQVTGTIKLVNGTYGMVVLDAVDASGSIKEMQIFVKDGAKILDAGDGKVKTVKDLKAGQNIMAAGAVNTGIFEATSIMILAQ